MHHNNKCIGIILIVLSFVMWALIPLVHMLALSGWWKGAADTALIILGEVFFWGGGLIWGREAAKKIRRFPSIIDWIMGRTRKDTEAS